MLSSILLIIILLKIKLFQIFRHSFKHLFFINISNQKSLLKIRSWMISPIYNRLPFSMRTFGLYSKINKSTFVQMWIGKEANSMCIMNKKSIMIIRLTKSLISSNGKFSQSSQKLCFCALIDLSKYSFCLSFGIHETCRNIQWH